MTAAAEKERTLPLSQRRALYARLAAARNAAPKGEERVRADAALTRCGKRLAAALAAAESRQRASAGEHAALARVTPAPPTLVRALLARTTLRAWCKRLRRDLRAQRRALRSLGDAMEALDNVRRIADASALAASTAAAAEPTRRQRFNVASDTPVRGRRPDAPAPAELSRRRAGAAFRLRWPVHDCDVAAPPRWRAPAFRMRVRSSHDGDDAVQRCLSARPSAAHESEAPTRRRTRGRRILSALTAAEAERDSWLCIRAAPATLPGHRLGEQRRAAADAIDRARQHSAYLARRMPLDLSHTLKSQAHLAPDPQEARDQRAKVEAARRRVLRFARFCSEELLALSACIAELTDYIHSARVELAQHHMVAGCVGVRSDPDHVCGAHCKQTLPSPDQTPIIALAAQPPLLA